MQPQRTDKMLVGKMKETDNFGDLRVAGKDMYRKEIRCEGVEKLQLVQNINLRVP